MTKQRFDQFGHLQTAFPGELLGQRMGDGAQWTGIGNEYFLVTDQRNAVCSACASTRRNQAK